MKSPLSLMTIVPAAGLVPIRAATPSEPRIDARVSQDSVARPEVCGPAKAEASLLRAAANWLVTEDEYFPFDADSFEER